MVRVILAVTGVLGLAACGPIPVEWAEQQCIEQAQLAQHPRGSVGFAADSHGNFGTSVTLGVSTDYLQGRDPDQVYQTCVFARSGQNPSRPFSTLPEARF
ncbi:MAG: hypothetical protein ABI832_05405 [bacterium]